MKILERSRVVLALALLATLLGLVLFVNMPRQEDPSLKDRFGTLVYSYSSGSAEQVQDLIARPLEDELGEVESIKTVSVTSRSGVAVIEIELLDATQNFNAAWVDIEEAIDRAEASMPEGAIQVEKIVGLELESVVLAVRGSRDQALLAQEAERLRDWLLALPQVKKIKWVGDPERRLEISVDEPKLNRMGLSFDSLTAWIQRNNTALGAGALPLPGYRLGAHVDSDLDTVGAMKSLRVPLSSGESVALGEIAQVQYGPSANRLKELRVDGELAVGLGIVAKPQINVVEFGERVRARVKDFKLSDPKLEVTELAYQPKRTSDRLNDLLRSLWIGMLSILIVLAFWMGWRSAVVVAISVPAITLIGVAVYALGGGMLHQISIAAFVVSLGQFVDNIIVILDGTQRRMHEGLSARDASEATAQSFKRPMIFATGTGAAAFLPMLASQGGPADFTSAFPVIAILTLVISYFFSIWVTPVLGARLLRSQITKPEPKWAHNVSARFARWSAVYPWRVVAIAVFALLFSGVGFVWTKKQFFPASDRNEFVFNVELPSHSSSEATRAVVEQLEARLKSDDRVTRSVGILGGGMPKFYYNLPSVFESPNVAQFLITTTEADQVHAVGKDLENFFDREVPEANGIARYLEQGPPIDAPIELRIFGDQGATEVEIERLSQALTQIKGVRRVRDSLGQGAAELTFATLPGSAAQMGVDRSQIASLLARQGEGLRIGVYRGSREIVPLVLRSNKKFESLDEVIRQSSILTRDGGFDLDSVTQAKLQWQPPALLRRNRDNYQWILADLEPGTTFSQVMQKLSPELTRDAGVRIEIGGESEGASEANLSIFRAVPLAIAILIFCLLVEFNSFRKLAIVLLGLPLVIAGIVPGLLIGDAAFGFMSLLGLLALIGIVVNNVILVLEGMEGDPTEENIFEAVRKRLRPVLMTSLLTGVGLLPLAIEESPLWPPLAQAMISGLIASVFSSLILVPALYCLFFRQKNRFPRVSQIVVGALSTVALGALFLGWNARSARADGMDALLDEVDQSPQVEASRSGVRADEARLEGTRRRAYFPEFAIQGAGTLRKEPLRSVTPFGLVEAERKRFFEGSIGVVQPILIPELVLGASRANQLGLEASTSSLEATRLRSRAQLGEVIFKYRSIEETLSVLDRSLEVIALVKGEVLRQVALGRASRADVKRVDIRLSEISINKERVKQSRSQFSVELNRFGVSEARVAALGGVERVDLKKFQASPQTAEVLTSAPEIRALLLQGESLESQADSRAAGALPKVELFGRYNYIDRVQLEKQTFGEVGLQLKWSLWDGGVRAQDKRELLERSQALRLKADEARLGLQAEAQGVQASIQSLVFEQNENQNLLETSESTLKSERAQFRDGRRLLSEVLDFELLVMQLKLRQVSLRSELQTECLRLDVAFGRLPRSQCRGLIGP